MKSKALCELLYFIRFALFVFTFLLVAICFMLLSKNCVGVNKASTSASALTDSDIVIIIDAGHGGEDGGAVSDNGIIEKNLNLDIALKLNEMLALTGYNSVLSRSEDKLLYSDGQEKHKKASDITNRIKFAEAYEKGVFISIHQNKFPVKKYNGLQVYYSKNNPLSKTLGAEIQSTVKKLLQNSNNRQEKQADKNIRILDSLKIPAVLIECGFLSNDEEAELLSDSEHRNKITYLIFCSLINYLNKNKDVI